jgi:hypothetical protein
MQHLVNKNPNGWSDHQTQQFSSLIDHYIQPQHTPLPEEIPPDLDDADYDLISADGSHLSDFQPLNEEEDPPPRLLGKCVGYLRYGKNLSLIYRKPSELISISTWDSNYAQDPNDRKSISGRINTVGRTLYNWTSKKQGAVTLSSTEAEYYSLS